MLFTNGDILTVFGFPVGRKGVRCRKGKFRHIEFCYLAPAGVQQGEPQAIDIFIISPKVQSNANLFRT